MKSLLALPLITILISGCSIYRSEGRKEFEEQAPQRSAASVAKNSAFQLQSCKNEGALETWFKEEFPAKNYELVLSDIDLEIWRTHVGTQVEIRALQKNGKATQACVYHFANDLVWDLYKQQFIRELENNMMME